MDGPSVGRPRTLFFGSGAFAIPILAALARSSDASLMGVVSAPPRPAGRDGSLRPTPVAELASTLGLPVLTPARLRDPASVAALADLDPGLIVLADYGRLVPGMVLDLPRHGALNVHPSLLPRHRGASPIPAAILSGDVETGVTLMHMDEGLDTGPIVATRRVVLRGDETTPELEGLLAELGAELLVAALPAWVSGRVDATPQAESGATLTRPLRRDDGRLDAASSATRLQRQVRAYQPWPGSFLDDGPTRLIVWKASAHGPTEGDAPHASAEHGAIVSDGDSVALVTTDGWLRLDEVQPSGRRRMTGPAYRRGRR